MLDQNTDRMWYVIGAVLIGAAIIFGMSTLMPEAFAGVNDNMQQAIGAVSVRIDQFSDLDVVYSKTHFENTRESSNKGSIGETGSIVEKNIPIEPGETYVLTYNRTGDSGEMHIFSHPQETTRLTHNRVYTQLFISNGTIVGDDWAGTARHFRSESQIYKTDDFMRVEFTANENENFLTLTHSNVYGRKLEPYEVFTVEYSNIELFKK